MSQERQYFPKASSILSQGAAFYVERYTMQVTTVDSVCAEENGVVDQDLSIDRRGIGGWMKPLEEYVPRVQRRN